MDSRTKEELLHLADEAMYLVKNTSRDSVAAANMGILPERVASGNQSKQPRLAVRAPLSSSTAIHIPESLLNLKV